ncbi:MAG TPA: hypothetical protein VLL75_01570 [Vicinamibacteria bacterium]|nr:hypothetical protein [Vicinamibacteria bacterium]
MASERGGRWIRVLFVAAAFLPGALAWAQASPGGVEPWIVSDRFGDRYSAVYGDPQWTPLEELLSGNAPLSGAVRTRGVLEASPRQRGTVRRYALALPAGSRAVTVRARLVITPGTVIRDSFDFEADSLNLREIEVVGTFQGATGAAAVEGAGFWFWAYAAAPERRSRPSGAGLLAIEDLIARPANLAKETVRVRGQFRGRNLFGDLAEGDAPPDGFVIKDGGSAVWVFGKKPKGDGWSLDVESRGDSSRWVEVEGKIEKRGDVTWLKASKVALVPPPRDEEPE